MDISGTVEEAAEKRRNGCDESVFPDSSRISTSVLLDVVYFRGMYSRTSWPRGQTEEEFGVDSTSDTLRGRQPTAKGLRSEDPSYMAAGRPFLIACEIIRNRRKFMKTKDGCCF